LRGMKIYTRSGDDGDTGLFGGDRVGKDDVRVRAYGAVDEANAQVGAARAALPADQALDALLGRLQHDLFTVGADLATPLDAAARAHLTPVRDDDVARLEADIDRWDEDLPPLTAFVLPGGHAASAALHLARAVARRAERDAVAASRAVAVNPVAVRWLNRLSDLLFVLARAANVRSGTPEVRWRSDANDG
ncbi:MAG: cob(I)yrinic acid a,c-diamide adenosyltransferase, partial [Trueperaceae bacterium]